MLLKKKKFSSCKYCHLVSRMQNTRQDSASSPLLKRIMFCWLPYSNNKRVSTTPLKDMADSIQKVDGLKMVIFDLDYTLWPFWIDTHVNPPFRKKDDKVYDSCNQPVKFYPEVPAMLRRLKTLGYLIGIASRTSETRGANDLLDKLGWDQYIDYKEIYPGKKTTHINRLCKASGCNLDQLLFFDDEHRNILDLNQINVCSILVENGINFEVLRKGIDTFVSRRK